ncbi:MAG: hypothetical protein VX705_08520 [Verrucomicrobiota bacterium]|nr:hypothetical protein [Verrucomicrobiota bacterium]
MRRPAPAHTHLLKEHAHPTPVLSCAFDVEGSHAFAGARDEHLQCLELATGKKQLLAGHKSWVNRIVSAPGTLYTADYHGRVIRWQDFKPMWNIAAHAVTVRGMAIHPDEGQLATGAKDGTVCLWNAKDGKRIREFTGHTGQVFATAWHPSGEHLLSAEREGNKIIQWNPKTGKTERELDARDLSAYRRGEDIEWGGPRGLAVDPVGKHIASCGRHKYAGKATVLLFDWETGNQTAKLESDLKGVFHTVYFHTAGFVVAAAGGQTSGAVYFWKSGESKLLAKLDTKGPAYDLALHPDGLQLALAHAQPGKTYPENGHFGLYSMTESPKKTQTEVGEG